MSNFIDFSLAEKLHINFYWTMYFARRKLKNSMVSRFELFEENGVARHTTKPILILKFWFWHILSCTLKKYVSEYKKIIVDHDSLNIYNCLAFRTEYH
jgi:hypothetical protein